MGYGPPQGSGPSAHLRLGTPLLLHVHGRPLPLKFEDLDDLINSFAEPLVEHVNQLLSHEKFVDGSWASVQVRMAAHMRCKCKPRCCVVTLCSIGLAALKECRAADASTS